MSTLAGTLEALDRVLNRGGGDVLEQAVALLHRHFAWAAIRVGEADGPSAGERAGPAAAVPIALAGRQVGALEVAPPPASAEEHAFVDRVALLVSPYCR